MNVLVDHVLKVTVLTEKTITAVPVIKVRNKVNILTCFLVCHNTFLYFFTQDSQLSGFFNRPTKIQHFISLSLSGTCMTNVVNTFCSQVSNICEIFNEKRNLVLMNNLLLLHI